MSPNNTALSLVVAVTSATSLLDLNKTPSLVRAIHDLQKYWPGQAITIAVDSTNESAVWEVMKKNGITQELVICDPNQPKVLAKVLLPIMGDCAALLIHDASRPLTSPDLFSRIMAAFNHGADAVRPAIAFTETLKVVGANSVIEKNLDRTQVKRISTPELIRISAIDPGGEDQGWFVPLKREAHIEYVEGNPESLRINSIAERDLLESFLHWKETNA